MIKNPLVSSFAVMALVGFAACGREGDDGESADAVLTDTVRTRENEKDGQ